MPNIKAGTTDSKKTTTKPTPKANIGLRPYFADTDKKYVHYLFYSTYFNLVPRAVRIRIQSPAVLAIWIAIYAYLITVIPSMVGKLGWSKNLLIGVQILVTLIVFGGGLIGLLWYTDKFDITNRVVEGIENDLKEPDVYYRGTAEDVRKGNFWVLTLNDEIVGCIGMDHTPQPVIDKSVKHTSYVRASERPRAVDSPEIHQAQWKKTAMILARADDVIRLTLVGVFDIARDLYFKLKGISPTDIDGKNSAKEKILFAAHKPNEASVRRLAIKLECQNHGLSTALLKRVAFWAHAHQIEYLYADVDELQAKLGDILVKRHGYVLVSKEKKGFFKTKSTYKLDVKLWMSKEMETRAQEKIIEDQMKEDAELKEYE
ncbi:hypothetical protein [Parasitella parasitica]|uniref:Uncharacterized protein n=1 Tax=Parasitella parasitica TaxID=35722 RepID=A0A0B7NCN5_9FUNG|nr:hypothetical protein [Parasitella parasitica]